MPVRSRRVPARQRMSQVLAVNETEPRTARTLRLAANAACVEIGLLADKSGTMPSQAKQTSWCSGAMHGMDDTGVRCYVAFISTAEADHAAVRDAIEARLIEHGWGGVTIIVRAPNALGGKPS